MNAEGSDPRRILVLGGASAIAQAYARRRAAAGAAFLLVGRNAARLAAIADDLRVCGAARADTMMADLAAVETIEAQVAAMHDRLGAPDEVLVAYATPVDQSACERDPRAARRALDLHFTSVVSWTLALLRERAPDAPLDLMVIGAVAGDRGRAGDYVVGAAKGGLDRFLEGLADTYADTPVHVLTVKPGLVDTPLTDAVDKGPWYASPDTVAADIVRAIERRRRVVYTPWFWRPITIAIRHLPRALLRKLRI